MSTDSLVKPYAALRHETLARDRGLREKVMSLEEAAKLVADGDHVAIGGCTVSRTPMAMVWALIRAKKRDLTVSRSITSTEGDLFFAAGVSRHIITSWFTQGIVWGVSKVMRHHTENKLARFEDGLFPQQEASLKRWMEELKDGPVPDVILTHRRDDARKLTDLRPTSRAARRRAPGQPPSPPARRASAPARGPGPDR